jgi:F0F1-type ATP synthase assembly protein I
LGVERDSKEEADPRLYRKTREKSPYFHLAIDFGYTLLAGVIVCGWLGWKADQRFSTTPLLLIVGVGLGIATGFSSLFRRLNLVEKSEKAKRTPKNPDGSGPRP